MHPLHKEKYVLSKEAFGNFTIDQHKAKLNKNKIMIKVTAYIQIIVGVLFIASVLVTKATNLFIFSAFAVFIVGYGIYGLLKKYPDYDKKIWANVTQTYEARGYGDNWFEVKFYEDHLKYNVGESIDDLYYNDFHQVIEGKGYFGLHFITGDLIMFNSDNNKEKIMEIIYAWRKKGDEEKAAEIAEESAIEAEIAEEICDSAVEADAE